MQKALHYSKAFLFKIGVDILSRALDQVPSAQAGLTSLFGMGRGDPRRYRHHKGINISGFEFKVSGFTTRKKKHGTRNIVTYLKKDTSYAK